MRPAPSAPANNQGAEAEKPVGLTLPILGGRPGGRLQEPGGEAEGGDGGEEEVKGEEGRGDGVDEELARFYAELGEEEEEEAKEKTGGGGRAAGVGSIPTASPALYGGDTAASIVRAPEISAERLVELQRERIRATVARVRAIRERIRLGRDGGELAAEERVERGRQARRLNQRLRRQLLGGG